MAKPVVIIGAGLAGISAALHLEQHNRETIVLESGDRAGGRVATDCIDGYLCDRGFQLINAKYPALQELDVIKEIDFIKAPRIVEVAMGTARFTLGDPRVSPWSALDRATGTLPEKLALIRYLLTKSVSSRSIGEELRAAGTGNLYSRVLEPFLSGVFLASPDRVDAIYGKSVIKSFVSGSPGVPRYGVGELSKALSSRLRDLRLGNRVEAIRGSIVETNNGSIEASEIIVATDATTASQLLDLRDIPTLVGCTTWYHSVDSTSRNGRLIIDGQGRGPIFNTLAISQISSSYAPAGKDLISTTTPLSITESETRRHLSLMWGCDTRDWELVAKYEIPSALPLQSVGRALSQSILVRENVYCIGDHRSTPSQQGALFTGRLAAQLILNK
jgi:phytoene dehydrogenase-like protein